MCGAPCNARIRERLWKTWNCISLEINCINITLYIRSRPTETVAFGQKKREALTQREAGP